MRRIRLPLACATIAAGLAAAVPAASAAQATPQRPAPAAATPAAPAAPASTERPITLPTFPEERAPAEAQLGVPIYPNAQFIRSYDAGQGQRYYLFGAQASFTEIVNYYKTILRQRGELVFERPATHTFDTGRFREETMAFPPGVTVKDFAGTGSAGYPNPRPGGQPPRFATVIQIVPPVAETAR
jgi:hypothetical protein